MYELIHSDDPETSEKACRWVEIEFQVCMAAAAVVALFLSGYAIYHSNINPFG